MTTQVIQKKYLIYVEDDPDDVLILQDMFSDVKEMDIVTFPNGTELLPFLQSLQPEAYPSLIVLDINTPKQNGWETVAELKSDPRYSNLSLVMFSTSSPEHQLDKSRLYGVPVITKPIHWGAFAQIAQHLLLLSGAEKRITSR